jgi:glycosyltransferase involved in cell wall biosynthesis
VTRTRIAHVIFPRPDPVRPVVGFVWDAVHALAALPDLEVEPILPLPMRAARGLSSWARKRRGRSQWPGDIEERLAKLDPRPTIVAYPPLPDRSIEMAAVAVAVRLSLRSRADRPAVIHGSFLDEGGYVAVCAARVIGSRSIAVAHGTDVRAAGGEMSSAGRKRRALHTVKHASCLVAVSEHLAARLALLGRSARIVRFSVPPDRFPLSSARPVRPVVLFVGRISRDKGVDVLLDAFARVSRDDVTLRLVGPLAGDLDPRAEAERLGVASRVQIDGEMPQAELASVYADASVTVLPSLHEGFGIVLVESLLVGRPVIGSDLGGIREIVTPDVGRLVRPRDPAALARALEDVLSRRFEPRHLRRRARPMTWEASAAVLAGIVRTIDS